MAIFNYSAQEMTAKIVYYGPGLSGKTTSLEFIHARINAKNKGKLVSLATETDRTLFFDFLPVDLGQIGGFKVKFNFYTVPGQVFYNKTRKLVLKATDGIVFVADSQPGMMDQNQESLDNLKENLKDHGINWEGIPLVIQYNKRDMPGVLSADAMRQALNPTGAPDFETVASTGVGVMEAMKAVCRLTLEDVQKKSKGGTPARVQVVPAAAPQPPALSTLSTARESEPGSERSGDVGVRPVSRPAGVERAVTVALGDPGGTSGALRLPVEFCAEAGVDAVQVSVELRVRFLNGTGQTQVHELTFEPRALRASEPERRKGFWARLFGRT